MRVVFVLLMFLAAFPATAAEREAKARPVPGDAQDLLLLLKRRPFLIRLHIQIDGRSFRSNWEESLARLFRYLDTDGDSVLSMKEAVLAPSKAQWVQLMAGVTVEPDAAPEFAELAGNAEAKTVTLSAFSFYYRNSGAGALQIEWGWRPPSQDRLSEALLEKLDRNRDGRLSREELVAAYKTLRSLDVNGNELIEASEFPSSGYYPSFSFRATIEAQPAPDRFPFVVLQADSRPAEIAGVLLKRYDHDRDGKLTRKECDLDRSVFDRLDTDHDGRLDAVELGEWRKLPPELELLISLGPNHTRHDVLLLPGRKGRTDHLNALQAPRAASGLRVPVGEKQLEVLRYAQQAKERQQLLKQFDQIAGKNGILKEKQLYQPPFTFVALSRLADRNGDNNLSRKELVEFLDVQDKFLFHTSHLTVVDRGASLFEFLDADHDGRLSPRELSTAWKRLSVWDRERVGHITRRQVPQQFQLVLGYGRSHAVPSEFERGMVTLPFVRDTARGPLWFRKMDRNGDGDVSQTEFLGSGEQFRRIDADGDGLIDADEAGRADSEFRKRK